MSDPRKTTRFYVKAWFWSFIGITAVSCAVYLTTFIVDSAAQAQVSLSELLFAAGGQGALANLPEVIAGILGITLTVVAIIVELAANRYTPRITELFVKSPVNIIVLGFFVICGLICIWVSLTAGSAIFVPRAGTVVAVFAISLSLIVLLPYFTFVFGFLSPHNVVEHMGRCSLKAIGIPRRQGPKAQNRAKRITVSGIEQLADVALNAIEHKDKGICSHAVDTLGDLTRRYLAMKDQLPAQWFEFDPQLRENPDFVSMQPEVIDSIEQGRFWLEMKVLRQYQMLYGETLNRMRDINYLIAINTRKIAESAMEMAQQQTTDLGMKFFNTFLRATINERDVRTAYNVLNQYRLLAEAALKANRPALAVEAAKHFKYYGQLGFSTGLPFVLETTAYDLCTLNEMAFDLKATCRDELLKIFLQVDKEAAEGHELEASLRGVRKAQIKLATYYLTHDERELARVIYEDMIDELPARLNSIREELEAITSKEFWEISDRGVNFDYLEPERRRKLDVFFGWFGEQAGAKDSARGSRELRRR